MIWLALLGFLLGPYLHHLGVVLGERQPPSLPRCHSCGSPRPLLGWRSHCRHRRWAREAATAVGTAMGFAGSAVAAGSGWLVPAYLTFAVVTIVLVITDFDHRLIPNRVLYPGGAFAVGALAVGASIAGRAEDLPRAALGGLAYFGLFFLVALVARGGFGFGDVKLAALLGVFAAIDSWRALLVTIFFTGLIGGIPAIALLVLRRARPHDEIPYGPAMVAGSWLAIAFWEPFTAWYLG